MLIRNGQQPSGTEGVMKKLLLLYHGPFVEIKDNNNNTYVLANPSNNKVKGTYNVSEMKKYFERCKKKETNS